jgi:SAM-dependent methyltransferase
LELGCGNGAISALFTAAGYRVTGVDLSPLAVDWARDTQRGEFHCADLCDGLTQFADCRFDLVVEGNCLHCIVGDRRAPVLAGIRRVLRPGGILVVSSMCAEPGTPAPEGRHLPTRGALLLELSGAGFAILDVKLAARPWWDHVRVLAAKT